MKKITTNKLLSNFPFRIEQAEETLLNKKCHSLNIRVFKDILKGPKDHFCY